MWCSGVFQSTYLSELFKEGVGPHHYALLSLNIRGDRGALADNTAAFLVDLVAESRVGAGPLWRCRHLFTEFRETRCGIRQAQELAPFPSVDSETRAYVADQRRSCRRCRPRVVLMTEDRLWRRGRSAPEASCLELETQWPPRWALGWQRVDSGSLFRTVIRSECRTSHIGLRGAHLASEPPIVSTC